MQRLEAGLGSEHFGLRIACEAAAHHRGGLCLGVAKCKVLGSWEILSIVDELGELRLAFCLTSKLLIFDRYGVGLGLNFKFAILLD